MDSLNRARKIIGSKAESVVFTVENKKAASLADCVLICTHDDAIGTVCSEVFTGKDINCKKKDINPCIVFKSSKNYKSRQHSLGNHNED